MITQQRKAIVSIAVGIAVLFGLYFLYEHWTYVSTDDAQIQAHFLMIAPKVSGTIQRVLVAENQKVKAGDLLAEIDPADYSNALESAKAQAASFEARYHEADLNFQRASELFKKQAISRERFDDAQASFKELEGRVKSARAQLEQATLNVNYTKILAPSDGAIARKSVEVGQFVPIGQPLFGFVASDTRWVTANFKETDLERIHPGRKATVEIDALSGKTFDGEVESVSPSTGAVFSLLPPDNATGNFTKVVQRVPIRIKLLNLTPEWIEKLQVGLSADVYVRVR